MITELVKWLCKWQTFLGAAIGGIIGLLSALIVARIADDYESYRRTGEAPRSKEEMDADADGVKRGFDTAVQHAICAEHLLSTLILSKAPTFNRIRMFIWKTKKEHRCNELLRTGTPNKALQADCLHVARSSNR